MSSLLALKVDEIKGKMSKINLKNKEQMANGDTSIHKYNFALQFSRTIDFFFLNQVNLEHTSATQKCWRA